MQAAKLQPPSTASVFHKHFAQPPQHSEYLKKLFKRGKSNSMQGKQTVLRHGDYICPLGRKEVIKYSTRVSLKMSHPEIMAVSKNDAQLMMSKRLESQSSARTTGGSIASQMRKTSIPFGNKAQVFLPSTTHKEFFSERRESEVILQTPGEDLATRDQIRKDLIKQNIKFGYSGSPMTTTNMELISAYSDRTKAHKNIIRKRDQVKESKERVPHFGDGLKLGERKELHESLMKSLYTSFKTQVQEQAEGQMKERQEATKAMRKTNIGMFKDGLILEGMNKFHSKRSSTSQNFYSAQNPSSAVRLSLKSQFTVAGGGDSTPGMTKLAAPLQEHLKKTNVSFGGGYNTRINFFRNSQHEPDRPLTSSIQLPQSHFRLGSSLSPQRDRSTGMVIPISAIGHSLDRQFVDSYRKEFSKKQEEFGKLKKELQSTNIVFGGSTIKPPVLDIVHRQQLKTPQNPRIRGSIDNTKATTSALPAPPIVQENTINIKDFGATHFNISESKIPFDKSQAFKSIYNTQMEEKRLIGAKPAENLSKNGKAVNVKLGFEKIKPRQVVEQEKLILASSLAAHYTPEMLRERQQSRQKNRFTNRNSNIIYTSSFNVREEEAYKSVQRESLNATIEQMKSFDSTGKLLLFGNQTARESQNGWLSQRSQPGKPGECHVNLGTVYTDLNPPLTSAGGGSQLKQVKPPQVPLLRIQATPQRGMRTQSQIVLGSDRKSQFETSNKEFYPWIQPQAVKMVYGTPIKHL